MDHDNVEGASGSSDFSPRHVAISVIPHFTGFLSFFGSLWIIIDILRDRRKKLRTTFHRIMLGMSLSDLLGSAAIALSTWPIPSKDSGVLDGGSVYGASGTQATCTAQGFFVQSGMAAPLYSGFLSLYYLLMVRYNWNETSNKMRCLENTFHALAWLLTMGTALASLGLTLYNSANIWCWIAPLPLDCVSSVKSEDGNGTCVRGDNAWVYRLAFFFIWIWLSVLCVTICMGMVFYTVYSQTKTMERYNPTPKQRNKNKNSNVRRVAVQASLYVGAFYLTIIFPSIVRMTQAKWNCTSEFFPLSILTVTFYPLQGWWNFLIYMRPRYLRYRKKHKDWSMIHVAWQALRRTICCTSEDDNEFDDSRVTKTGTTATSDTTAASSRIMSQQDSQDLQLGNDDLPAVMPNDDGEE